MHSALTCSLTSCYRGDWLDWLALERRQERWVRSVCRLVSGAWWVWLLPRRCWESPPLSPVRCCPVTCHVNTIRTTVITLLRLIVSDILYILYVCMCVLTVLVLLNCVALLSCIDSATFGLVFLNGLLDSYLEVGQMQLSLVFEETVVGFYQWRERCSKNKSNNNERHSTTHNWVTTNTGPTYMFLSHI